MYGHRNLDTTTLGATGLAMAASRIIEEETGTWSGLRHRHNGYYAGDFSDAPFRPLVPVSRSNPTRLIVRADRPRTARPAVVAATQIP